MSDTSIYDATVQTEGTLALAHEKILRAKIGGVFVNITGDANNIAGVPTKITVPRENYGNKGRTSENKLGDNWVITCDVEAVRDDTGHIAQSWLISLLNIAKATGDANKVDLQLFDGKDEALGAIQGSFSVEAADLANGFADKAGYKFTFTSDGVVNDITSPIASDGKPVIESVTPTGKTVGDLLVVKGYHLGNVTAVTMDTAPVVKLLVIDENTLTFLIPATVAGAADIIATNEAGASVAVSYTAV